MVIEVPLELRDWRVNRAAPEPEFRVRGLAGPAQAPVSVPGALLPVGGGGTDSAGATMNGLAGGAPVAGEAFTST